MNDYFLPGSVSYGRAPKEMRFAGKEFCMQFIWILMIQDEDIKELAEVKNWDIDKLAEHVKMRLEK